MKFVPPAPIIKQTEVNTNTFTVHGSTRSLLTLPPKTHLGFLSWWARTHNG